MRHFFTLTQETQYLEKFTAIDESGKINLL